MIWGFIAYNWVGPLIILPTGRITGCIYTEEVLAGPLWDLYMKLSEEQGEVRVMEDGAPVHNSAVAKHFQRQHNMLKIPHPSQSPDLNPIEHVWMHIKCKINKRPVQPKSTEELIEAIKEEWAKLDVNFIDKLIDSMPNRIEAVYKARGGPSKY